MAETTAPVTKKYRPSNGSEGEAFINHWCARCNKDEAHRNDPDNADGCAILAASFAFNIEDENYPTEWIEDADGKNPRCTSFDDTKPMTKADRAYLDWLAQRGRRTA